MWFLKLVTALPLPLLECLVRLLFWLTWPFTGRERRLINENIERVYALAAHSSFAKTFVRQVLESQVLIYLETAKYVFSRSALEIVDQGECERVFAARTADGSGQVVITAHLGSWELAGHFAALALKKPFHVLAKPSRTTWINPILNRLRELLQMNVLWTDSKALYRHMLKAVDAGEGLGFVMDQRPGVRSGGHVVPFLGVPDTMIVSGPAKVMAHKNLGAVGVYCVREGRGRYRVITHEILPAGHGITDEVELSRLLAADMESVIRLYPEQWAWNYRRWKH